MTVFRPLVALVLTFALAGAALAADDGPRTHKVTRGQTLGGIAKRYGGKTSALKAANKLRGTNIRVGQQLTIPDECGAEPPAATETAGGGGATVTHTVLAGETLAGIAERYGVTVDHLKAMNKRALTRRPGLRIGQELKLKPTRAVRPPRRIRYRIEAGDTLGAIAERYDLTAADIRRMNPRKDPRRLRIGDTIDLWVAGPEVKSAAVGRPQHGQLVNGEQLPAGRGYVRRRPERAYATNETISLLIDAIATVRAKHPKLHDLAIGDISTKNGGFLSGHRSHQTGRDVDLGFYFQNQPPAGPKVFLDAMRVPLDLEGTWALVNALAGPSPDKSRCEYMFIGYPLQKKLYDWAKEQGVSERKLAWLFQYPRGSRAMQGLVRHEPGHTNHIHVRFKCPRGDKQCR